MENIENVSAECVHARKLVALVENPQDLRLSQLRRHVEQCSFCQRHLSWLQQRNALVNEHVPNVAIAAEIAAEIQSELKNIFQEFRKLSDREPSIYAQFFSDIRTVLCSKVVITSAIFAMLMILTIRLFS